MKKRILFFSLLATILAAGFVSCGSDDEEDNSKKNQFEYGIFKSEIAECYITFDDDNEFTVALIGTGVSINLEEQAFTGTGTILAVNLETENQNILGKYTIEPENSESGQWIKRAAILPVVSNTKSQSLEFNFGESAEITISKPQDNIYEIVITGKDENGASVSAYYKGKATIMSGID